ncbi:hypothetical protein ADK43_38135 [Streptomyces rimosus subsp. rimosus]|nr:hypothetical protein ADK43_38135 [Streptomyces rimosus subsp. rimosus]
MGSAIASSVGGCAVLTIAEGSPPPAAVIATLVYCFIGGGYVAQQRRRSSVATRSPVDDTLSPAVSAPECAYGSDAGGPR